MNQTHTLNLNGNKMTVYVDYTTQNVNGFCLATIGQPGADWQDLADGEAVATAGSYNTVDGTLHMSRRMADGIVYGAFIGIVAIK